jgi:hypothetical protein
MGTNLTRDELLTNNTFLPRIRGEYREMPGMRLTVEQAQRLWGLDRGTCENALGLLVEERFLTRGTDGAYSRPSDLQLGRPQMLKADLSRGEPERVPVSRER